VKRDPISVLTRLAAATVALVAGYASFHHIITVALRAGERKEVAWSIPIGIDGLIAVCWLAMIADRRAGRHPRHSARWGMVFGIGATLAANIASARPDFAARAVAVVPPLAFLIAIEVLARQGRLRKERETQAPLSTDDATPDPSSEPAPGPTPVPDPTPADEPEQVEPAANPAPDRTPLHLVPAPDEPTEEIVRVAPPPVPPVTGTRRPARPAQRPAAERTGKRRGVPLRKPEQDPAATRARPDRAAAEAAFRASVGAGQVISGAELGRQFGGSTRWGQALAAELVQQMAAERNVAEQFEPFDPQPVGAPVAPLNGKVNT
jgi:Protein of unknown function (DUF2637)